MSSKNFSKSFTFLLIISLCLMSISSVKIKGSTSHKTISKCAEIKMSSSSFEDDETINIKYTAYGDNISPQLSWKDAPEETKSFALVVEDPDALKVAGKIYIHWIIKNIPADVTSFNENDYSGEQIQNMAGQEDYFGPKPPSGTGVHHYHFKIYALSIETIDAENYNDFTTQVQNNKIGEGKIVALFEKN